MPIIYRKTTLGLSEIETRAHRLAPRLRSALIVVDGRRTDAELAAMLPQGAESLAALAAQGFIEAVAEVAASAPRAVPAPLTTPGALGGPASVSGAWATSPGGFGPTAGMTAPGPLTGPSSLSGGSELSLRRRTLLRAFNDLVGPAGESLAIRMEKARSLEELEAMVPQAVRLVELVRGRDAAASFGATLAQL